jgi:hypothetical protein
MRTRANHFALNSVLCAPADDRHIASGARFTAGELNRIATVTDINNSDIDFCEYSGHLVIYYSWGNRKGIEHLASAMHRGTEAEFLEGWFPSHRAVNSCKQHLSMRREASRSRFARDRHHPCPEGTLDLPRAVPVAIVGGCP